MLIQGMNARKPTKYILNGTACEWIVVIALWKVGRQKWIATFKTEGAVGTYTCGFLPFCLTLYSLHWKWKQFNLTLRYLTCSEPNLSNSFEAKVSTQEVSLSAKHEAVCKAYTPLRKEKSRGGAEPPMRPPPPCGRPWCKLTALRKGDVKPTLKI